MVFNYQTINSQCKAITPSLLTHWRYHRPEILRIFVLRLFMNVWQMMDRIMLTLSVVVPLLTCMLCDVHIFCVVLHLLWTIQSNEKSRFWLPTEYYRNWYQDWGHCGELPRSLVTPQWPKSRYQFPFCHDASKHIEFMPIWVCISRKSPIKLLKISHYGKHGQRPWSQKLP